jgi:hypothetical protein
MSSSLSEFGECRERADAGNLAGAKTVKPFPFVDVTLMNFTEGDGVVASSPMRPGSGREPDLTHIVAII